MSKNSVCLKRRVFKARLKTTSDELWGRWTE